MGDISEHNRITQHLGEIKDGGGEYDIESIEIGALVLDKIEGFRPKNKVLAFSYAEVDAIYALIDDSEYRALCRAFIDAGSAWDAI
jgi:hypothetical protein